MFGGKILLAGYTTLALLVLFSVNCYANNNCVPSCGNNDNITHPFRLKGDPKDCGDEAYELECEKNRTVLHLFSGKYYVEEINYHNYTIRVVDVGIHKDDCSSLPLYSLTYYDSFQYPYYLRYAYGRGPVVFMNCENPVKSPLYIDNICSKGGGNSSGSVKGQYLYVVLGDLNVSDVADLCTVEMMVPIAQPLLSMRSENRGNISFWDVHDAMAYGFELGFSSYYGSYFGSYYFRTCAPHRSSFLCLMSEIAFYLIPVLDLIERSKRALVYEFMPNGSLEKYIFSQEGNVHISCTQMYEISLGVARGIEYLHRGCDIQILHFDIKPHNILLDENFTPKLSDFGLAKLYPINDSIVSLTAARGTMGYMAPELFYKNIGGISYKADVYSFGMLLMEMAGRRRNLNVFADHTSQIYFPSWVYDESREGRDIEMGETTEEERVMVKKMIIVALWCIQMNPSDRPSMNKVAEMLEGNVELLQMPPKPSLCPQEMPVEDHEIDMDLAELPMLSSM
ncbi:hypothetical protein ACSBR1_008619 [Camellia fascicularis]